MRKPSKVAFAELREFLKGLRFKLKPAPNAWVFSHPAESLIVFRLYDENETMAEGDVRSTRMFLDMRDVLEADVFDVFVQRATPA